MSCVIFGAGKIARGFIGHLLFLSGIEFTFVEKAEELADELKKQGRYTVNILGAPEKNCIVSGYRVLKYDQADEIAEAIAQADAVFDAVGGKNLGQLIPFLTEGIEQRAEKAQAAPLNIVTCENWKNPAGILKEGIEKEICPAHKAWFADNVGVTEAVILRSAIEASEEEKKKDPLIVNVQDYWQLHVDASRLRGNLPAIEGLHLLDEFGGFLERKFYTYNAANGTTSYLGALKGYRILSDAAHDEWILGILDGVYHETSRALCKKYGFSFEEQWEFTRTSLRKLQNRTIVDYIERNARDPLRKLGPDDRLVGSARMVYSFGEVPKNLCTAIAAAIYYTNEDDESARELKKMRDGKGPEYVLQEICHLEPDSELGRTVLEKIADLKKAGLIQGMR